MSDKQQDGQSVFRNHGWSLATSSRNCAVYFARRQNHWIQEYRI